MKKLIENLAVEGDSHIDVEGIKIPIIYKVITGSVAYGLNTEDSDIDITGFILPPINEYVKVNNQSQLNIDCDRVKIGKDIVYYSAKRALELLSEANPNIVELLWMPRDCILEERSIALYMLIQNRRMFITKKAYNSHAKYALAQIKKAKGKNKKVHNPCPKERPPKEDFCHILFTNNNPNNFPCRPIPLKETGMDLQEYHVSSLEHVPNVYRMYHYGKNAKGVFRGDMLCCESIPKEHENDYFTCLLIYNANEYDKAVREWKSYWEWVRKRNDKRWIKQEQGFLDFDSKNMSHCVRLIYSAINILKNGEPLVRFEGEKNQILMDIKMGLWTYEQIMKHVEKLQKEMDESFKKTLIPDDVDKKLVNEIICDLYGL